MSSLPKDICQINNDDDNDLEPQFLQVTVSFIILCKLFEMIDKALWSTKSKTTNQPEVFKEGSRILSWQRADHA